MVSMSMDKTGFVDYLVMAGTASTDNEAPGIDEYGAGAIYDHINTMQECLQDYIVSARAIGNSFRQYDSFRDMYKNEGGYYSTTSATMRHDLQVFADRQQFFQVYVDGAKRGYVFYEEGM